MYMPCQHAPGFQQEEPREGAARQGGRRLDWRWRRDRGHVQALPGCDGVSVGEAVGRHQLIDRRADAQRDVEQRIALYDALVNNADRKAGHVLRGLDGSLWAIDHGLTFHRAHKLRTVIWDWAGQRIPEAWLADVDRLRGALSAREDPLCAALDGLLSPDEINALRARAVDQGVALSTTVAPGLPAVEVDPQRIGCLGVSLGGWRTIFLAGMDERIAAACVVGFMSTVQPMIERHIDTHSFAHFVPGLHQHLDLPDVVSLLAPKPLLVQQCKQDGLFPLSGMEASISKIGKVYEKAGVKEKFSGRFYDVPHRFDVAMQDEAYAADIAQRAKDSIVYRKGQGKTVGMPPFGTIRTDRGYLEPSPYGAWLLPDGQYVPGDVEQNSPEPGALWPRTTPRIAQGMVTSADLHQTRMEFGDFAMMRRMLLGIRQRAESRFNEERPVPEVGAG